MLGSLLRFIRNSQVLQSIDQQPYKKLADKTTFH